MAAGVMNIGSLKVVGIQLETHRAGYLRTQYACQTAQLRFPIAIAPLVRGLSFLVEFSRNSKPDAETAALVAQLRAGNRRANMRNMRMRSVSQGRLVLGLLLCCAAAVPVWGREINVQEAVSQAQHETDGKVLSVQTLNVGKRKVYRIKLLTRDGQVRIMQVPAEQ